MPWCLREELMLYLKLICTWPSTKIIFVSFQVLKESEAFLPDELPPPPPPTSAAKTDETAKEPATAEAK